MELVWKYILNFSFSSHPSIFSSPSPPSPCRVIRKKISRNFAAMVSNILSFSTYLEVPLSDLES